MVEKVEANHEDIRNNLARVFHESFSRKDLAPPWGRTTHKYRLAVLNGIDAMLKHMQDSKEK